MIKIIKRIISWLFFPCWFIFAAIIIVCSMLRFKYTSKLIRIMDKFVNWNDRVLMNKK